MSRKERTLKSLGHGGLSVKDPMLNWPMARLAAILTYGKCRGHRRVWSKMLTVVKGFPLAFAFRAHPFISCLHLQLTSLPLRLTMRQNRESWDNFSLNVAL